LNDILRVTEAAPTQGRLFQRLRFRLLSNSIASVLSETPIRLVTILFCSLLVWGGIYVVSLLGFAFLQSQRFPLTGGVVGIVFDLMFLSLAMLLVFSTGIILYSSLFSSAETAFLLTTPARADHVFVYKYQGAVAFSSWAFILLGSPVLLAFGLVAGVPWYYYALLPLFFLGYVLLPGSLGAILCLLVVNFFPRRPRQVLVLTITVLVFIALGWFAQLASAARNDLATRDGMQRLLGQFAFARGPMAPNHWMAVGMQAAARGKLGDVGYYLALIWSNGLFLYLLTAAGAVRAYRRGYNRVMTGGMQRKRYGGAGIDRWLSRLVGFVHPQIRLLIIKDFRTFRRDPAQWAQILIFSGLLTLYFVNVRRFYSDDYRRAYQLGISLLNLTATALLLCAYTGRFIFPMLSLEGRKFWILGLLPLQRQRLLWGKFVFSSVGALFISGGLVVLSDLTLGLPWLGVVLHAFTIVLLALGLSGLSVGLGACVPNFKESDPSKIAVGFGGTLNLVASLFFLVAEIVLIDMPWHVMVVHDPDLNESIDMVWLLGGVLGGLAVGVAAVWLPLAAGSKALERMEF
jgi:ABC-2 type transport system permease protein